MVTYSNLKKTVLLPIVGDRSQGLEEVSDIGIPVEGNNYTPVVSTTVGEYREFAFLAAEGYTWTCLPDSGNGTGTLLKKSEELFPFEGDGKIYSVYVKVDSVLDGTYQLGFNAENIIVGVPWEDDPLDDTSLWTIVNSSTAKTTQSSGYLKLYTSQTYRDGGQATSNYIIAPNLDFDFEMSLASGWYANSSNFFDGGMQLINSDTEEVVAEYRYTGQQGNGDDGSAYLYIDDVAVGGNSNISINAYFLDAYLRWVRTGNTIEVWKTNNNELLASGTIDASIPLKVRLVFKKTGTCYEEPYWIIYGFNITSGYLLP